MPAKTATRLVSPVPKSKQAIHRKAVAGVLNALAPAGAVQSTRLATVHTSRTVFQGKVFSVSRDKVTEPGGVTSIRDVIRHNGSVVILAVALQTDPYTGEQVPAILIERQYRHAAGKFLLELPAGRIEPGEQPLAAAKRELIEETGYRARRWSRLVRYYASPGFLAEHMQVFLAEDIRAGIAQPEEDEKIELRLILLPELLAMIHAGKIEDAKTLLAVLLYASRLIPADQQSDR